MRCALLAVCFFFFRRQPPCQILQRKKANESETVRVPKQRGSENVRDTRHSLLCRALQCASIISNFSRSGMKNGHVCRHTRLNKRCSSRCNSALQAKISFPLFPLSVWLLVEGEDCRFWNAGPSPACYCWVSKEHPGASGISFERALCQGRASPLRHTNTFNQLRSPFRPTAHVPISCSLRSK